MKINARKLILAAITATSIVASGVPAMACGGSSRGRVMMGPSSLHRRTQYRQPTQTVSHRYTTPRYQTQSHPPTYNHYPSTSSVIHSAPTYSQPVYSQPVYSQPTHQQTVPTQSSVVRTVPAQPQSIPTQPIQSQQAVQTQQAVPSQQSADFSQPQTQTTPQAAAGQQGRSVNSPASSALAMLASMQTRPAEVAPVATSAAIPSFGPAATQAPAAPADHVGVWSVSLPGNQSVTLKLTADGQFEWAATKDGKSSRFAGQYRMESGRLALVRSSDLQKMEGSWIASGNNMVFKVDGDTAGALSFSRI